MEVGRSETQGYPGLHCEFNASLGYMRLHLRKSKEKKDMGGGKREGRGRGRGGESVGGGEGQGRKRFHWRCAVSRLSLGVS